MPERSKMEESYCDIQVTKQIQSVDVGGDGYWYVLHANMTTTSTGHEPRPAVRIVLEQEVSGDTTTIFIFNHKGILQICEGNPDARRSKKSEVEELFIPKGTTKITKL